MIKKRQQATKNNSKSIETLLRIGSHNNHNNQERIREELETVDQLKAAKQNDVDMQFQSLSHKLGENSMFLRVLHFDVMSLGPPKKRM